MPGPPPAARLALTLLSASFIVGPPVAVSAQREHAATESFAAPDGTRLVIDAATVDVRLRAADVREVEVATELHISGVGNEQAERYISSHTPVTEVTQEGIIVTVGPAEPRFLGLGTFTARARLGFLVPGHVVPDVTTTAGSISIRGDLAGARPLYLRTTTGDIEVIGAAASVDLRTASGDARFELLRPLEHFFARSSSGSVDLTGGARAVHADTASGDVSMCNLSGDAEVITSTGRITLSWDRIEPDCRVIARSDSGRIRVTLPEGVAPRGSLQTIAGRIQSAFPGVVNDAGDAVALSGDGPELLIESASGDIVLEAGTWWGGPGAGQPSEP